MYDYYFLQQTWYNTVNACKEKFEMKNVTKDAPVLDVLAQSDKTFYIPVYQRNYSWKKEQIDILFNDVVKLTQKKHEGHFFGSLYYFVESSGVFGNQNLVLIDGQQRLTTIMLFLIAIRDLSQDKEFRQRVEKTYLLNNNITEQNKIKLKQAALDNREYEMLIREENSQNSTHRVTENYRRIKSHIQTFADTHYPNDNQAGLMSLLEGLNKLYIVLLELDNEKEAENPQIVFENINSIGLELTVNDLIRNYLLMGLGKELQESLYQNYWVPIEKSIGDIEKHTPLFIRHFLHMKQLRRINQNNKEIYRTYKEYFRTSGDLTNESALAELCRYSNFFAMIVGIKEHRNEKVTELLFEINTIIKRNVSYCFLLKILSLSEEGKIEDAELIKLLGIVISYSVRRTILNLGSGGSMDELFIGLTSFISESNNIQNISDEVYSYLSKRGYSQRFPFDNELKEELKKRDFYSLSLKYYILEKASNEINHGAAPIDFRNHSEVQYEHIMPQSLTRDQDDGYISGEVYDEFFEARLHTLSNATLTDINQQLGNLPFDDKKIKLNDESNLLISRIWITDKENWDVKAMDDRFELIFEHIAKAFPYPSEFQKSIQKSGQVLEYTTDEISQDEIDISSLRIVDLKINDKIFSCNNNATKLYINFLEALLETKEDYLDSLCDNAEFKRRTTKFGGLFNFSRDRSNVTYGEINSLVVKELSNGILVDTNFSRAELINKMNAILSYLGYYEKVTIVFQEV